MVNIGQAVVNQGVRDIGIAEVPKGSNAGGVINDFLALVGLPPRNPWCCAFRCWLVHHVFVMLGQTPPDIKTGSTGALVQWAQLNRKIPDSPQPGDAVCVKGNTETGYEHTATLFKIYPLGLLRTIDGNWGDKVSWAWHHVSQVTFVREWL
jgi:hypothetical protein